MRGININETIKKAITEAIKEFDSKRQAESKAKILHNTRVLLNNYNSLASHYEKAVDNLDYIELNEDDEYSCESIESNDKLFILSIRRSKFRTMIMVTHIKAALDSLRETCIKKNQPDKYKVLEMHYLQDVPYGEIAKEINCSEITARRWKNEMVQDLGVYLFGVDAL